MSAKAEWLAFVAHINEYHNPDGLDLFVIANGRPIYQALGLLDVYQSLYRLYDAEWSVEYYARIKSENAVRQTRFDAGTFDAVQIITVDGRYKMTGNKADTSITDNDYYIDVEVGNLLSLYKCLYDAVNMGYLQDCANVTVNGVAFGYSWSCSFLTYDSAIMEQDWADLILS